MRRVTLHNKWIWLTGILVLLAIPASVLAFRALNSSPGALCGKAANATGVIDSIVKGGVVRLYDPTQKTLPSSMGRVSLVIRVEPSTRIFRQTGAACQGLQQVSFSELRPGQTLKIWSSSGMMLQTYPGQLLDISDIVIVP
jgi:hypothetical protein